jgi:hypothetical protein
VILKSGSSIKKRVSQFRKGYGYFVLKLKEWFFKMRQRFLSEKCRKALSTAL